MDDMDAVKSDRNFRLFRRLLVDVVPFPLVSACPCLDSSNELARANVHFSHAHHLNLNYHLSAYHLNTGSYFLFSNLNTALDSGGHRGVPSVHRERV
jgi:hypothetical protein